MLYSIDSKQPFIYKERPQFSQAIGYCCINKFGEFAIWNTSKCVICTDKYIPASKEQRDFLFQKMKEAGYEWDAKRKILIRFIRSIKPNNENAPSIWSEEDECHFNDALWCCKQAAKTAKDENNMGTVWYAEKWLKSIKDRIKPQWKPSDEQINALDEVYKTHGANSACRRIIFNLLEQLKKL